jgi:hypothetical protein
LFSSLRRGGTSLLVMTITRTSFSCACEGAGNRERGVFCRNAVCGSLCQLMCVCVHGEDINEKKNIDCAFHIHYKKRGGEQERRSFYSFYIVPKNSQFHTVK